MHTSFSSVSAAVDKSQPATVLEEVNSRIDRLHTESAMLADRLQRVLTRAFGEKAGEDGTDAKLHPVSPGIVGSINERLDNVEAALASAREAVTRLDRLV